MCVLGVVCDSLLEWRRSLISENACDPNGVCSSTQNFVVAINLRIHMSTIILIRSTQDNDPSGESLVLRLKYSLGIS